MLPFPLQPCEKETLFTIHDDDRGGAYKVSINKEKKFHH